MNKKQKDAINGLLLLDKPKGITSNDALQRAKKILGVRKAGHTGSLDPLASGMLPLCLGEATKFSRFLLEADKTYEVKVKLGIKTETGDAEGEAVSHSEVTALSMESLNTVLHQFLGDLSQVPSKYSAIKYQGKPLYKWAREGYNIQCEARTVSIYQLELLDIGDDWFKLYVHCGKGTYIRKLVEDIANATQNDGHVVELRRLSVGSYQQGEMWSLQAIRQIVEQHDHSQSHAMIQPTQRIVESWPQVDVSPAAAYYIQQGQPVILPYAPPRGWVKLIMKNGDFLGVGKILDDGRVTPKRLAQLGKIG